MDKILAATIRTALDALLSSEYGIGDALSKAPLSLSHARAVAHATLGEMFHEEGTILDAANTVIDLKAELDPAGDAIALTTVYAIYIENQTAVGGANLIVGNSGANAFSACFGAAAHTVILGPGDAISLPCSAGLTVDGTHKDLKLEHDGTGAADIAYRIVALGRTT